MIVLDTPRGWRCVTQQDHARLSHDILSLWRTGGFPSHIRRQELLFAVREHDNGWQEADSAPRIDVQTGRIRDFTTLGEVDRVEVWRRGIGRHRAARPHVAALICEHARHLHAGSAPATGAWGDFLAGVAAERDEALIDAGLELHDLLADYRWLHIVDFVSLAACAGWHEPFERWGLRGHLEPGTVHLEPFPLAGATTFSVACRFLKPARFTSDAEMAGALATCRWQQMEVRIAP